MTWFEWVGALLFGYWLGIYVDWRAHRSCCNCETCKNWQRDQWKKKIGKGRGL